MVDPIFTKRACNFCNFCNILCLQCLSYDFGQIQNVIYYIFFVRHYKNTALVLRCKCQLFQCLTIIFDKNYKNYKFKINKWAVS